jgi:hypothetical protein
MAMFEGNLLGDGGARKAAGCGLGARFLAGEKCCCRAENGFLSCGSTSAGREIVSSADPRVGGRLAVGALETIEDDLARVWLGIRGAAEGELAEGLRRCRELVSGGRDRSCLTGSVLWLTFECRFEDDLLSPPVVGLPMLARAEGGRIKALLTTLLAALGGLADVDRTLGAEGFIGSRLGDCLPLYVDGGSGSRTLFSLGSCAEDRVSLVSASAGFRRERDREGIVDMSALLSYLVM